MIYSYVPGKKELSQPAIDKTLYWHTHCRQDKPKEDWDITFLKQAFEWSKRSHDAQTACGAVLTTSNHHIIATGYNGFIRNIRDDVLPNLRPDKYPFMIHSEHNCILDCAYQGKSAKDGIMYVTGEPCLNCYQTMYQAGVSEIVYGNNHAVMTQTDEDYKINVEIFLWLTKGKLKVRHIDYPSNGV